MPGLAAAYRPNGSAEIIDLDAVADCTASTGPRWFSLGDTIFTYTLISWPMPPPPCILFQWILLDCRGRWFVAGAFEPKALLKLMDSARDYCEISPKEAAWVLVRARVPLPPELEGVERTPNDVAPDELTKPRLSVSKNAVTLDGKTYVLDDGPAAFVRELVDAGPGMWVAGPSMGDMVQPKPSRAYGKLQRDHPEIAAWVESSTFKGYRLRVVPTTPG